MHISPGAIHMHTTYSDGSGSVEELALAAQQAGLRWIIITDHDTLAGLPQAGWLHDVLVIIGHEITPDRNHFLALNLDYVIDNRLPPQDFIDAVYAAGGFGIIAHPDETVANDFKDIYCWEDWSVDGPRERAQRPVGIELWNVMSDWAEHLTQRNKAALVLAPHLGLSAPTAKTMDWWDRLNMQGKRTFGIGGVDAHAFKRRMPWGEISVLPYTWIFGTLTNYLMLDAPLDSDPHTATHQVYAALAGGQSYFVNRLHGDCPDLVFEALRRKQRFVIGANISLAEGPVTFQAQVSLDAELQLIHNGQVLIHSFNKLRHTITEPGIYRLEAHRKGKPWMYTNPLYIE